MSKAFGRIEVRHPNKSGEKPLILTFFSRKAMDDASTALNRNGYIADPFWGYAVSRSPEEALKTVKFWCGKIAKKMESAQ